MVTLAAQVLKSRHVADTRLLENASENMTLSPIDGHTQKDMYVKRIAVDGSITGVNVTARVRRVNPLLQAQVYKESSTLASFQTLNNVYTELNDLFGSKGENFSFASDIDGLAEEFTKAGQISSSAQKKAVVDKGVDTANNLNNMGKTIQIMRSRADSELNTAIEECNNLLGEISRLNLAIVNGTHIKQDTTDLEDQRDLAIHSLSGYLDIEARLNPAENIMIVTLAGGSTLLNGQTILGDAPPVHFNFTPSPYALPGVSLKPVMLGPINITPELKGGKIGALIEIRDKIMPDLQAEMDELARHLRDEINAIHNQGTSSTNQSTLTGTVGVPGLGAALNLTVGVSGTGTLRIATLNNGGIVDYKDITLTDGMTISSLLDQINTIAPYGLGNSAGTFTASLTAAGQLQISSSGGYGIGISSLNNSAQMSLSATYDPTNSYGFSHFFGLNNFFDTDSLLASNAPQAGVINNIKVHSKFINNFNFLPEAKMSTLTPAPTSPEGAVGSQDRSIFTSISKAMKSTPITFEASGQIPEKQVALLDYGRFIINVTVADIISTQNELKSHETFYTNLAKVNSDYSASNPELVVMEIVDIASNQILVSKSLSIILNNERKIADILS